MAYTPGFAYDLFVSFAHRAGPAPDHLGLASQT
jgi:hypothetical protein